MEFDLSPHIKAILCGRGMCKGDRLLCASSNCKYHPKNQPDPDFGKDILVKGYGACSRCGSKTDWSEREWNDREQRDILKCKTCKLRIPRSGMVWTQGVFPRHRGKKHYYYHAECWDAKYIDVPNGDNDEEEKAGL